MFLIATSVLECEIYLSIWIICPGYLRVAVEAETHVLALSRYSHATETTVAQKKVVVKEYLRFLF